MKCKCNNCDFIGDEEDLSLFETKGDGTETITAEETADHKIIRSEPRPENPFYFKGCPNCKTDGYLMDIDEVTPVTGSGNKHTAGDWAVEYCLDQSIFINSGETPIAMIQSKDDEGITDEMTANANLIAGAPKLLEMLQLALRDPKKLDDTATAYWLSTKYPVTKAVQEKADYYSQFVNAIKVATNGI